MSNWFPVKGHPHLLVDVDSHEIKVMPVGYNGIKNKQDEYCDCAVRSKGYNKRHEKGICEIDGKFASDLLFEVC